MMPATSTPTPRKRGRPEKSPAKPPTSSSGTAAPIAISDISVAPMPSTPTTKKRKRLVLTPRCGPTEYSPAFLTTMEIVNDLNNFCGIGTLDIRMPRRAAAGMEAPDGWLWLETPAYKPQKDSIEADLKKLVKCWWIRCTYRMTIDETDPGKPLSISRVRVYVLPDDIGRRYINRDDPNLRRCLKTVIMTVDDSRSGWKLRRSLGGMSKPKENKMSLFYMFNTMNSPSPDPESFWIKDENTKTLLRDILNKDLPGMKTELYGYQKRTVAMMIQKELAPEQTQDPRLEDIFGPNGDVYFQDSETAEIFQDPRYFEDVKGGILAEEMGTGKTLLCLAVILATKHQCSYVPEEYVQPPPIRESVGSLLDMCVAAVWRNALPWKEWSDEMSENCKKVIQENHGYYEAQPTLRSRSSRYLYDPAAVERVYLGTGTIVVCPQNLVDQWKDEIEKHLEKDALKVLVLAHLKEEIPPVPDLLRYDVIIFSRPRFDYEARAGRDQKGRREPGGRPLSCQCPYIGATRTRNCNCFKKDGVYRSPLMSIQWKRLIVDEGHSMASASKSNSVCVAEKLPVERRWIVTGTPTSELVGVIPGMVMGENEEDQKVRKDKLLEARKEVEINEALHLERIGKMVCDFLKQEPWTLASWKRYMSKGFIERRPGSTAGMKGMFQKLFIRHTPEHVEDSVKLPPIYPKLTPLEPGFLEKVSMNLLLGGLAVNAVTSERTGKDYIFDKDNRKELRLLIDNLWKRSGFYSSGYSIADVNETIKISKEYLEKNASRYSAKDIELLKKAIAAGEMALGSQTWKDISICREMVYFLSEFPEQLSPHWSLSFDSNSREAGELLKIGGSQIQNLQKSLNAHASEHDITSKLEELGKAFKEDRETELLQEKAKTKGLKPGIPESSMSTKPLVTMRETDKKDVSLAPVTPAAPAPKLKSKRNGKSKTPLKSAMKQSEAVSIPILPLDSPLAKSQIVGTASKKLTYLLNKIVAHHKTEKILVFYQDPDTAWYLAQALEILGIENLAYSAGISSQRKSSYLSIFQRSEKYRVLVMDLNQAAHGLNVASASRVFFMNPVWQNDIEQQAIKRAHRIGQTKSVIVETLYLAGTIEEEMLKRRQAMTEKERSDARTLVDDLKMRDIIQSLEFLEVEGDGVERANLLDVPEPLFGDGKHGGVYEEIEDLENAVTPSKASLPTPSTRQTFGLSPAAETRVTSDLNDNTNYGSSSSKRKRTSEASLAPPSVNLEGDQLLTLVPPRKRRIFGLMGNPNRDFLETDDEEELLDARGSRSRDSNGGWGDKDDGGYRKEKKVVRFG